jgi:hypothetical protein
VHRGHAGECRAEPFVGRFLAIVATLELFGSCDGSGSPGMAPQTVKREWFARLIALGGSNRRIAELRHSGPEPPPGPAPRRSRVSFQPSLTIVAYVRDGRPSRRG